MFKLLKPLKFTVVLGSACFLQAQATETFRPNPEKVRELEKKLEPLARHFNTHVENSLGYPVNQNINLNEFYQWYLKKDLPELSMNNVGNPKVKSNYEINTHKLEQEVIEFFAPKFGFAANSYWGFVTDSGTDGNNHGLYFGRKYLQAKTKTPPIIYVSEEAHYSVKKLADVQNTDIKIIKSTPMGQMDLENFKFQLDSKRPALVVAAIGTTFKGAIDEQEKIISTLKINGVKHHYLHLDAALFGGYLPFLDEKSKELISQQKIGYHSVAVSGHKFFGFDNPLGFFITTKEVFNSLNPFNVEYLGGSIPTISCSRSGLAPLKFWWKIQLLGDSEFEKQAQGILENAAYLEKKLRAADKKTWRNPLSNTVFFERPVDHKFIDKYDLALEVSPSLGELAHVVVMQSVSKEKIDAFVNEWVLKSKKG